MGSGPVIMFSRRTYSRLYHGAFILPIAITVNDNVVSAETVQVPSSSSSFSLDDVGTLEDRTVIVDKRFQGGFSGVEENDLVIYSSPYTAKRKSIGRVLGCQKDWVRIDELHGFSRHMPVPEGYCWIEGI